MSDPWQTFLNTRDALCLNHDIFIARLPLGEENRLIQEAGQEAMGLHLK